MLDLTYYKRLITSEYRRSTNFTAMVERLLSYGLDLDSSATDLITAFEVDYARLHSSISSALLSE